MMGRSFRCHQLRDVIHDVGGTRRMKNVLEAMASAPIISRAYAAALRTSDLRVILRDFGGTVTPHHAGVRETPTLIPDAQPAMVGDHPALLAYWLVDEPSGGVAPDFRAVARPWR
jgi:hypothetical protein